MLAIKFFLVVLLSLVGISLAEPEPLILGALADGYYGRRYYDYPRRSYRRRYYDDGPGYAAPVYQAPAPAAQPSSIIVQQSQNTNA